MTPAPPPFSPLGFTRAYQTYRAENAAIPFPDSRLLAAARFWTRYAQNLRSDAYATFWREDLPPLLDTVTVDQFEDLHPDDLAEIATFIASLDLTRLIRHSRESGNPALSASCLWGLAAKKWFYVGEADHALQNLAESGLSVPEALHSAIRISNSAFDLPAAIIERLGDGPVQQPLSDWLMRFDAEWRATRESGHTNVATCVLVERDAGGNPIRGRLRTLEARVEPLAKSHDSDEVVFGHQLRAADDPQVKGAYAALSALRNGECGMRNAESKRAGTDALHSAIRIPQSAFFRARFTFTDSGREPYGGDSLGFACLVAAFGDWWSKDLHRERRLISAGTALTGALNTDSSAKQVSESSLAKKVERVFFSPLTSLVVPKSNRDAAEAEVARLHEEHPARRLRILTAERATDLMTDGNIMIPERVCLGEYAVRAAAKYSRSLKVQIPILILLVFIAGWLAIPTARAILDRNPVTIEYTRRGFNAMNQYGHAVWKQEYPVDSVVKHSPFVVFDLDGDKRNEILYFIGEYHQSPDNAKVDVFNTDGSLRFRLDPVIPGQYPGDYDVKEPYSAGMVNVAVVNGRPIIVTGANAQNPSRFHIKMWSAEGDSLGWYVNAGVVPSPLLVRDFNFDGVDELVLPAYNIRMRAVSLVILKAAGSFGVSPPYWDEQYDLSRVIPGNQPHYMLFPITDLTLGNRLYNNHGGIHDVSSSGFRFDVLEGGVRNEQGKEKFWSVNYYIDSTFHVARVDVDDTFKARREALVQAGTLPAISWPEYFRRLQDTVTYWTADGWVSERGRKLHTAPQ